MEEWGPGELSLSHTLGRDSVVWKGWGWESEVGDALRMKHLAERTKVTVEIVSRWW